MIIRDERQTDIEVIGKVTLQAFENHPYSQNTEQFIIVALRAAQALTLSRVAEIDGKVVGHIAFSPVTVSDGSDNWYGVGPVSVLPEFQKQGIGKALIRDGLAMLKALGAGGCVLVGDPAFYHRFGFRTLSHLTLAGAPPENFLALPLSENSTRGSVTFHPGFAARE